jgi:carbamoyl-phosphate synthase small subunit
MNDASSAHSANAEKVFSRGGLMLADGTFFEGTGFGAVGSAIGEVCFNTAMTGYQEILSDPSYAGQIVAFTFPHIGIVGTNGEDIETTTPVVRGLVVRTDAEHPSNYRNLLALDGWLKKHNIPAVAGIDTRALTSLIREKGMPHGVVVNLGSQELDREALIAQARSFAGLVGLDLAKEVT